MSTTTMGPRTAEAWRLRSEGLTYAEIARRMNCSDGNVCKLVAYAKRHVAGLARSTGRPRTYDDVADDHDSWNEGEAHCARCGLRGAHECLSGASLGSRRGEPEFVRNKVA